MAGVGALFRRIGPWKLIRKLRDSLVSGAAELLRNGVRDDGSEPIGRR
jgi:hypothetical protein